MRPARPAGNATRTLSMREQGILEEEGKAAYQDRGRGHENAHPNRGEHPSCPTRGTERTTEPARINSLPTRARSRASPVGSKYPVCPRPIDSRVSPRAMSADHTMRITTQRTRWPQLSVIARPFCCSQSLAGSPYTADAGRQQTLLTGSCSALWSRPPCRCRCPGAIGHTLPNPLCRETRSRLQVEGASSKRKVNQTCAGDERGGRDAHDQARGYTPPRRDRDDDSAYHPASHDPDRWHE